MILIDVTNRLELPAAPALIASLGKLIAANVSSCPGLIGDPGRW